MPDKSFSIRIEGDTPELRDILSDALLDAIKAGNCPEAARMLCGLLASGKANDAAKAWLSEALQQIADGAPADEALGMKLTGKERPFSPVGNPLFRDRLLAMETHDLLIANPDLKLTRNDGTEGKESASDLMAKRYSDTLKLTAGQYARIYRKHFPE
jgi:hypothetical protein